MIESELIVILFGTGAFLLFLLVILMLISVLRYRGPSAIKRNVRDEVRRIKEQIENPPE